jgi:hypothetical protein
MWTMVMMPQEPAVGRTKPQTEFIQSISGPWKIVQVFAAGEKFDDKISLESIRVTEGGVVFRMRTTKGEEVLWTYEDILPDEKRSNLLLDKDGKKRRYVMRLRGESLWLVTRNRDNSRLPDVLVPDPMNLCIRLERPEE